MLEFLHCVEQAERFSLSETCERWSHLLLWHTSCAEPLLHSSPPLKENENI